MKLKQTRRTDGHRLWWFRAWLRRLRVYWTATGVIPRWQLVAVYLLICSVGTLGFVAISERADENEATAAEAKRVAEQNRALTLRVADLARTTATERAAGIEATCERNSSTVDILIVGSNQDIRQADTPEEVAGVERRRDVTLGLLAALRPNDCPPDSRLPEIPPRKPGPSPTPIPSSG